MLWGDSDWDLSRALGWSWSPEAQVIRVWELSANPRRRQWQPTPVLLPGKSHGQRSLVGCSPRGRKESGTTERLHFHFHFHFHFLALWEKLKTTSGSINSRMPRRLACYISLWEKITLCMRAFHSSVSQQYKGDKQLDHKNRHKSWRLAEYSLGGLGIYSWKNEWIISFPSLCFSL